MSFRVDWDEVERYQRMLGETPESERKQPKETYLTPELETYGAKVIYVTKSAKRCDVTNRYVYTYLSPLGGVRCTDKESTDARIKDKLYRLYEGYTISIRQESLDPVENVLE